ncbi:hypothetical protein [Mycoplasma mycoides]|uniref:hypothetical protein n=1 Tax=Mycoplasma mycoides TaxID=2102 RepID=UPI002240961B
MLYTPVNKSLPVKLLCSSENSFKFSVQLNKLFLAFLIVPFKSLIWSLKLSFAVLYSVISLVLLISFCSNNSILFFNSSKVLSWFCVFCFVKILAFLVEPPTIAPCGKILCPSSETILNLKLVFFAKLIASS